MEDKSFIKSVANTISTRQEVMEEIHWMIIMSMPVTGSIRERVSSVYCVLRCGVMRCVQVPGLGHVAGTDVVRWVWRGRRGCGARQLPGLGRAACPGAAPRACLARHQQLHAAHPAARTRLRQLR